MESSQNKQSKRTYTKARRKPEDRRAAAKAQRAELRDQLVEQLFAYGAPAALVAAALDLDYDARSGSVLEPGWLVSDEEGESRTIEALSPQDAAQRYVDDLPPSGRRTYTIDVCRVALRRCSRGGTSSGGIHAQRVRVVRPKRRRLQCCRPSTTAGQQ